MKNQLIKGLKWSFKEEAVIQSLNFLIGILLVRFLTPEDFGLVGMITVITGYSSIIINFGLGAAIVQRPSIDSNFLSSIFWINAFLGLVISSSILFGTRYIANMYQEPQLETVIPFVALSPFLSSLFVVHNNLLRRQLEFNKLFWIRSVPLVLAGIVAVVLAYNGFGAKSIVFQGLFSSALSCILFWINSSFVPRFVLSRDSIKDVFNFSAPLFFTSTGTYIYRNIDSYLIAQSFGSVELGLYNRAYSLMRLPVTKLSNAISKVYFPVLSRLQGDISQMRDYYLNAMLSLAIIILPIMSGLGLASYEFIEILYGAKWLEVAPLFQILAIASIPQALGSINGNIYLAQGRTKLLLAVSIASQVISVFSIVIGLRFGSIGVCYGVLVSTFIVSLYNYYEISKILNLSLINDVLKQLLPLIGLTIFIVFITYCLIDIVEISLWPSLIVKMLMICSLHIVAYNSLNIYAFQNIKRVLYKVLIKRFKGLGQKNK